MNDVRQLADAARKPILVQPKSDAYPDDQRHSRPVRRIQPRETSRGRRDLGCCKRCRPLNAHDHPDWVSDLLADLERAPNKRIKDADLQARGIHPSTVRRHFLRVYGMSFQAFARERRLVDAHRRIRDGAALDGVILESGYESYSGFRDAFARAFNETPGSVGKSVSCHPCCAIHDWPS